MAEEQLVTAYFELREDADKAIERLGEMGVGRDRITIEEDRGGAGAPPPRPGEGGGLFGVLQDTVTPNAGQGEVGGGGHTGYVVTVQAGEGQHDQVLEILGRDGSVQRDERTAG